ELLDAEPDVCGELVQLEIAGAVADLAHGLGVADDVEYIGPGDLAHWVALGILDVEAEVDEWVRGAVGLAHPEHGDEVLSHALAHRGPGEALPEVDTGFDVHGTVDGVLHR